MKYKVFTNSFRSINRLVSKKLLILLLIAAGFAESKAQVFLSVAAKGKIFNVSDSVCYPTGDSYYIYVKNTGSIAFSGAIRLSAAVDTSSNGFHLSNYIDSTLNTVLAPGDSIPCSHTEWYDTSSMHITYRMGGNIVVIWPSATGAITVDSSKHDTVTILDCTGINEIKDYNGLSIYPNPCTDNIALQLKGKVSVSVIRLFNIQGEMLKEYRNTNSISFAEFSAGMYFLRVEFADKTTHTYKIIRKE